MLLSLIFTAYSGILVFASLEWGLSASAASSIQSGWHAAYLVSLFVSGLLADRFGHVKVYVVSSILSSIAATLFAIFSSSYWSALSLYALAGLLSGGTYTSGLAIIFRHTNDGERGKYMGYFLAAASAGYAGALGLIGLAVHYWSWRYGLYAIAGGSWIGTALAIYTLRSLPDCAEPPYRSVSWFHSLKSVVQNRKAMAINWAYLFHCFELFALWAWMPAFLVYLLKEETNLGPGFSVVVAAGIHFFSILGSLVGGAASDRYGRLPTIAVLGLASAVLSLLAGATLSWPAWIGCLYFACFCLFAIADSAVLSTVLAESVPHDYLGAAYSLRSVMGYAAGACSPFAFGLILDYGISGTHDKGQASWAMAWSVVGMVALLVPAICYASFKKSAAPGNEDGR